MKPVIYLLLLSVFSVLLMVSCSNNDDDISVMNPTSICGQTFYDDKLMLNDSVVSGSYIFEPVNGDSTQLWMNLRDLFPDDKDITINIEVKPENSVIYLEGQKTTKYYDLKVNGSCRRTGKNDVLFDIKLIYAITGGIDVERTYTVDFTKKDAVFFMTGGSGYIDFDGKKIETMTFMNTVMDNIRQRTSEETSAMQLIFHKNARLDLKLKDADKSGFRHWMTLDYYLSGDESMIWIFTAEQGREFVDKWFGQPKVPYPPFLYGNPQYLNVFYNSNDNKLYFGINTPFYRWADYMYINAKGLEGTSEKERQALKIFHSTMSKAENPYTWMPLWIAE